MYQSIVYTVGKKTIEVGSLEYTLGEITTEVLNIPFEEYKEMKAELLSAEEDMKEYFQTKNIDHWRSANEHLKQLDRMLCVHSVFANLKDETCALAEADSLFTSLFQTTLDGFAVEVPDDYLSPGDLEMKWTMYLSTYATYRNIVSDLYSFNYTIQHFISFYLTSLKKLDSSHYAAALCYFLNDDRTAEKLIANPFNGSGLFAEADSVVLRYIPRQVHPYVDKYEIYEYYEAKNLQTLLKTDFYRALSSGHIIRRCECCERYFLLTKGYHTKYCDRPNPENPRFTCAQIGYRNSGQKEVAQDDPRAQSLHRCYQRLNKDVSRGVLTSDQRDALYKKANDLYFEARTNSQITFAELDRSLATVNLCQLCSIERKTGKVGRPRKQDF